MKLNFEEWIHNQNISTRTEQLIDEAINCYRGKAYRASLLFSFLSFQNIIKERILNSVNPPGYTEDFWRRIQSDLRNDDKWESMIIECVNRNNPGSIFRLSEDIKNQYFYWKDRRNDCAHAKGNKIGSSHVETFWLFFESNLGKFGVNGGKESFIERLNVFFDASLTPIDEDPTPLINDITSSVELEEFNEVLEIIYDLTGNKKVHVSFWKQLFNIEDEYREVLIDYLKEKDKLCLEILEDDPSLVYHFSYDEGFIRYIWKDMVYNSYLHYKIILSLLRHRLIPESQLKELVNTTTSKISTSLFRNAEEEDLSTLVISGFFDEFKYLAFEEMKINNFDWARENRYLVVQYILKYGFDEIIVKAINNTFMGGAHPWKLKDELEEMFNTYPHLVDQYKKINDEIEGILPEYFFEDEGE